MPRFILVLIVAGILGLAIGYLLHSEAIGTVGAILTLAVPAAWFRWRAMVAKSRMITEVDDLTVTSAKRPRRSTDA